MAENANYDVFRISLAVAGTQWFERAFDFLRIARFEDAGGAEILTGKVTLTFGRNDNEGIPLGPNGGVKGNGDVARLTWTAQAGVYAIVVASRGDLAIDTPPARALITSAGGNAIAQAVVNVGTVATVVSNVSNRLSVTLQNNSSTDIFVGSSTVTAAGATQGVKLTSGQSATFDKTTATIYAIVAAGTADLNVFEEYSA